MEKFDVDYEIVEYENKMPEEYKKYFWDSDFEKLDVAKHKEYILNRLLSFGDLDAIRYVFANFSKNEISEYVN